MASARTALRLVADAVWYLGWVALALGAVGLLIGRQPSPGSEWNAAAAGGLLLVPLGVLGALLGGVLRWAFRPRKENTPGDAGMAGSRDSSGTPAC